MTTDMTTDLRADPDAGRHRHRRAAGEVSARARQAAAPRRIDAVPGTEGRVRGLLRGRSAHAGDVRAIRSRRTSRSSSSAAVSPACWPGLYLKKAGVEDVRVIEMAGDFGGVWYWNRFPGIQCDNDAYCYIPMLEELDFIPSKKFADGAEIFEHCRTSASISACTTARSSPPRCATVRWDESIKRWRISTNRGDDIRARFVVMTQAPTTGRSCPASPGSRTSRVTCSTRRAGTTTTPAETRAVDCTSWRTSVSRSSAPAPPACSWFRISAEMPSTSTCSSARRRRSTCAATQPTDPEWAKSLQPGWQEERKRNFHTLVAVRQGVVFGRAGSGLRLLDRTGAQHDRADRRERGSRIADASSRSWRSGKKRTTRSWSGCGAASRPSSTTRRPPRRSSRTTGSCASGRAATTSICRPSTARTSRWSTCRSPRVWNG